MTGVIAAARELARPNITAAQRAAAEQRAKWLLGDCVSDNELAELGQEGLINCDVSDGRWCETTCGTEWSKVRTNMVQ
jgi:hypothetical protein